MEPGHTSILRGCPHLTPGSFTQQGGTEVCCISTENQMASLARRGCWGRRRAAEACAWAPAALASGA